MTMMNPHKKKIGLGRKFLYKGESILLVEFKAMSAWLISVYNCYPNPPIIYMLQVLNDRFANYIDRVRSLESENQRLTVQIQSTEDTTTREISNLKVVSQFTSKTFFISSYPIHHLEAPYSFHICASSLGWFLIHSLIHAGTV